MPHDEGDQAPAGQAATICRRREACPATAIRGLKERDFSMDDVQILDIVHQTATEMMAAKDGGAAGAGFMVSPQGADSLTDRYGFSSIDTLQCVLILEKKLGITLADEDLSHEVLSSATALARHIATLQRTQASARPAGAR
jgi:acyl carrier protein